MDYKGKLTLSVHLPTGASGLRGVGVVVGGSLEEGGVS